MKITKNKKLIKLCTLLVSGAMLLSAGAAIGLSTSGAFKESVATAITSDITPTQAATGSDSTKYVTEPTTYKVDDVSYVVNQWNPKTLQVKVNGGGGDTSTDGSNFSLYNSSALPDSISKIEMTFTSTTTVTASWFQISTGSEAITTNQAYDATKAGTLKKVESCPVLTWKFDGTDTFFRLCTAKGSGTVKISSFTVTYGKDSKTLDYISISESMLKTDYIDTEEWDPSGLSVTATYSDKSTEDVTADAKWSFNPEKPAVGVTSVDVTATFGEKTDTVTVNNINVTEADKYQLVNSKFDLVVGGSYIIANADATAAMGTKADGNNRPQADVTKTDDGKIKYNPNVQIITLGGQDGAWTLGVGDKYLYAAGGANNNYLKTYSDLDDRGCWTVSFDGDNAVIVANDETVTSRTIRYNSSSTQLLFSCYAATSQKPVSLYWLATEREITNLTVSGDLVKKEYITDDEAWDLTGLVATLNYSDGSSVNVTDDVTWTVDPSVPAVGVTSITVTASYDEFDSNSVVINGITVTEVLNKHTVTFESNGGSEVSPMEVGEGRKIEKPEDPVKYDYVFDGWYKDEKLANLWDFDNDVMGDSDITLYAKWRESIKYVKYTCPVLTEGDYVLVGSGTNALSNTIASNRATNGTVTFDEEDNTIVRDPSSDVIYHLEKSGEYWTFYNEAENVYLASTGKNNQAKFVSDVCDEAYWEAHLVKENVFDFINVSNRAKSTPETVVNANLRNNGASGWATYATATGSKVTLYKLDDGSVNTHLSALVGSYMDYQGQYTKKTTICFTEDEMLEMETYFHAGQTQAKRTTYYDDLNERLLMAEPDGSLDPSYGGYRFATDCIERFHANETATLETMFEDVTVDFSQSKGAEHLNDVYKNLSSFLADNYFAEGWEYDEDNSYYIHKLTTDEQSDDFYADFLAFAAPMLKSPSSEHLTVDSIIIEDATDYLSIRIVLDETDSGKVTGECGDLVMSEARIYKGFGIEA